MDQIIPGLQKMQAFFEGHTSFDYAFRKAQLTKLKKAILDHEQELHNALYTDLKKSPEESWVTETGFLMVEINHTIRNLRKWMRRERVGTNLLNFPSSSYIYKEPLGVVLIIGPWNYPLQLLFNPLVGAIAAGNCVVLKPSEFAPATAEVMKKIIAENFDPAYIRLVEGDGAAVIPEMMNGFRFNHVFYTGSTSVGQIIYEMAAKKLVPVTLELGGKSPCVVEEDANIKITAKRIALTKFSNAGQMCVAPDYLLVHEKIKAPFMEALKESIQKFYTEEAHKVEHFGKIINLKQYKRLEKLLENGKVYYGGKRDEASLFIEPTILEDVSIDAAVMGEEIFGPILPVIGFNSFEEARDIIRRNPEPLAFYVFTGDSQKEARWLEQVPFGGGCVNNASWHLTNVNLPFGGRGGSGMGAYHGKFSFDVFSHKKAVMKTPTWFDPGIKYPPFKGKLNLFKKLIR
ncbi:MAG: aldehyde dehydrogenase [Flavisolibacter sp.]